VKITESGTPRIHTTEEDVAKRGVSKHQPKKKKGRRKRFGGRNHVIGVGGPGKDSWKPAKLGKREKIRSCKPEEEKEKTWLAARSSEGKGVGGEKQSSRKDEFRELVGKES